MVPYNQVRGSFGTWLVNVGAASVTENSLGTEIYVLYSSVPLNLQ